MIFAAGRRIYALIPDRFAFAKPLQAAALTKGIIEKSVTWDGSIQLLIAGNEPAGSVPSIFIIILYIYSLDLFII